MEKVITRLSSKSRQSDLEYWLSKTPQERLAAIELLRQQYIKFQFGNVPPRFCRVFTIINIKNKKATGRTKDAADAEELESK